jgi:chromate transport protein ChrA
MVDGEGKLPPAVPAATGGWLSASTWIALAIIVQGILPGILLAYMFILPAMSIGLFEVSVLYYALAVGVVAWIVAMFVRVFVRKRKELLLWTALRYGVIALGGAALLVPIVIVMQCFIGPPGYVRITEKFLVQMKRDADIPSIREWAETQRVKLYATSTPSGEDYSVPIDQWPTAIQKLKPARVLYDRETHCVHVVFGGGLYPIWGLSVAPKGTLPSDDQRFLRWCDYTRPLEDGAWVWSETE